MRQLRRRSVQAFTLIELLIVVAILGILVVAAIPAYQQARSAALIGSLIGELTGFAKQCAVINATGVGDPPTPTRASPDRGGVQIAQGCTGENQGATLEASWGAARASGVPCLESRSQPSSSKATIVVTPSSTLSCLFAD